MDFIMLISHRLSAIAMARLALEAHVLGDPVIRLKVFSSFFSFLGVVESDARFVCVCVFCPN